MKAQDERIAGDNPRGERLQRLAGALVEKLATGRQELVVRDRLKPMVNEVEALPHALQHAPPHQLFDPFGGRRRVQPSGPLEKGELELTSDHGRHGRDVESDPSTWIEIGLQVPHPSVVQICTPANNFCADLVEAPEPGFTDLGLLFLTQPAHGLTPQKLAPPHTLETPKAADRSMTVVGYGFIDSLPGGGPPPMDEWPGLRRVRAMQSFESVIDESWARWREPSGICFGDSGGAILIRMTPDTSPNPDWRLVAVVSDGGDPICGTNNVHARVDTVDAQQWIRETIRTVLERIAGPWRVRRELCSAGENSSAGGGADVRGEGSPGLPTTTCGSPM